MLIFFTKKMQKIPLPSPHSGIVGWGGVFINAGQRHRRGAMTRANSRSLPMGHGTNRFIWPVQLLSPGCGLVAGSGANIGTISTGSSHNPVLMPPKAFITGHGTTSLGIRLPGRVSKCPPSPPTARGPGHQPVFLVWTFGYFKRKISLTQLHMMH